MAKMLLFFVLRATVLIKGIPLSFAPATHICTPFIALSLSDL